MLRGTKAYIVSLGKQMLVLGIETTCDETAAAVVRRDEDGRSEILSNIVLSQTAEHQPYGGVVPEIAARAHVEALDLIITRAMVEANASFNDLDGIAAAAGQHMLLTLPNVAQGNQQTAAMMTDDLLTAPLPIATGPSWGLIEGPGLGIEIDEDKLARYREAFRRDGQFLPYAA